MKSPEVRVLIPRSMKEFRAMRTENPAALLYAGGTDLLVKRRNGSVPELADLICLEGVPELGKIEDLGHSVFVGAGCTHARILEHPLVRRSFPVLTQALEALGSPPVRHMGTLGGNICTASPAGDSLPPLYVLEARLELATPGGTRRVPVERFITGPGATVLEQGEILYGVLIPKSPRFNLHHYEKVGQRNALSISIASLACVARISPMGIIEEIRLAWGSVGPTVIRSGEIERELNGKPFTIKSMERVFPLVSHALSPIDDVRAGARYRLTVSKNLLLRLVHGRKGI